MRLLDVFAWPPKCSGCNQKLSDWAEAGSSNGEWFHKQCWQEGQSEQSSALDSPMAGMANGLPMIVFLLFFHFGGGAAVMGWFMMSRFEEETQSLVSLAVLVLGLVSFFIGLFGFALEILLRMRAQSVRNTLELIGGWEPVEAE